MLNKLESDNSDNLEYEVYIEERKLLVDALREGARSFDKTILALASGAFGLSLTFIRQIVPNIKSGTIFMLICSWVCFCICLLSTLISFLTSQSACLKQIEILEAEPDKKASIENKNKSSDCTRRLNILSISIFILGIIFLISFSISNLLP
jgi:hypothetical protein